MNNGISIPSLKGYPKMSAIWGITKEKAKEILESQKLLAHNTCLRCGHLWTGDPDAGVCPKCKTPNWRKNAPGTSRGQNRKDRLNRAVFFMVKKP
jgi:hypothetical protein